MDVGGRRALRERFDDGVHLDFGELPDTRQHDVYLATDASVIGSSTGLGALAETPSGKTIGRWRRPVDAADNNDAETRALHFGLDRLSTHSGPGDRIGILVDHEVLATAVATCASPASPTPVRPPIRSASVNHWGGITARIAAYNSVHVALVSGLSNPAHGIAHGVVAD